MYTYIIYICIHIYKYIIIYIKIKICLKIREKNSVKDTVTHFEIYGFLQIVLI